MIRSADEDEFQADRSPNVTWHPPDLGRDERWSTLGVRGATIWLTGLPASGKSTIAVELERRLVAGGRNAYLLDGDNVRHGISGDLGFSPADRAENARRVAGVARLFADAGLVSLVVARLPVRRGPRARPRDARAGRAAVHRGLRRHAGRGVRAARPQGSVRACSRGRPARLHRRRRRRTRRPRTPSWSCARWRSRSPTRSSACSPSSTRRWTPRARSRAARARGSRRCRGRRGGATPTSRARSRAR